jgi:acyl-CoA reductase-like NAD-dependent aldehyde dehydrogenase
MRLGEHLNAQVRAGATPAPTHPVSFKAIARGVRGDEYLVDTTAVLAFVDEEKADAALDAAEAAIRAKYPDGAAPPEKRRNAIAYQMLLHALRDAEEPRAQLASTVEELRKALVKPVAVRLYAEYVAFVDKEFPPLPTTAQLGELAKEAEKNS